MSWRETAGLMMAALVMSACAPQQDEPAAGSAGGPSVDEAAQVARGEYLVTVLGCNDCHTPFKMGPAGPEPDMSRMLSGHPEDLVMPDPPKLPEGPWTVLSSFTNTAFAGPWGVSYSANLTPDPSGLSAWSADIFIAAMRTGKHWGVSRNILPPMPWPWFSKLTDEDLRAIFAYLTTIPPVSNQVPDPKIIEPPAG